MRITEPAAQVNAKAVALALRCFYIKKNTDHRNMLKSYPVVGFISCLFVCLLFLFKMGKCELLFVQNLQLVVAHHSQAFNKAFNNKSHFRSCFYVLQHKSTYCLLHNMLYSIKFS